MQVFISTSGEQSRRIGNAIRDWLPDVLQFVETWISSADIGAGQRWAVEVGRVLEACKFGILCVTPENIAAPWLLFEAGALSKSVSDAAVIPLLYRVNVSDISNGPLGQFQAKKLDAEGVLDLLRALNACGGEPLEDQRLRRVFESMWPWLEKELASLPKEDDAPESHRSVHEILEEVVIGIQRIEGRLPSPRIADPLPPWILDAIPIQSLSLLRESATRAVQESSLRAVARTIGMSPMGLQHFLNGTQPYRGTLKKINLWYLRFVYPKPRSWTSGWDLVGADPEDMPDDARGLDPDDEENNGEE
jgi:hypothetical protein